MENNSGGGAAGFIFAIVYLGFIIAMIAGYWAVYAKAGKPGWAAIVPIYNLIVLLEIVNRPIWGIALMFIPLVNFVVVLLLFQDLARAFGKGTGTAAGLLFLPFVFFPLLGFGDAQYAGAIERV